MSKLRRAASIITGLLQIALAIVMLLNNDIGFLVIFLIISIGMTVDGLKNLIFYLTMARHMVGGKSLLYRGLIMLDIGVFSLSLADIPRGMLILYMLGIHAFNGVVDILRALEAKRFKSGNWKLTMGFGIANIAVPVIAVAAGLLTGSMTLVIGVYSVSLIYSAIGRIITACRKTAVCYIQ
jgi:uncharacterized membrane protein HdeD (DUF308 family)